MVWAVHRLDMGCEWAGHGHGWECSFLGKGSVGHWLVLAWSGLSMGCTWAGFCMGCPGHGLFWECAGLVFGWIGQGLGWVLTGLFMAWDGHGCSAGRWGRAVC